MRRMQWLAEKINRRGYTTGCEVGSAVGNTTKHLLQNCPRLNPLYVADDWRPITDRRSPETPNVNPAWYSKPMRPIFDKKVAPYLSRLIILEGESWKMADRIKDGILDFVFIDASHDFNSVVNDIKAWLPKVKKSGLLCGHDIHMSGVREALEYLELDYTVVGIDNVWSARI